MKTRDIDLLIEFLQTRAEADRLAEPQEMRAWLEERELLDPGAPLSPNDARSVIRFRAAVLSLLAEHSGSEPDPRTRAVIAAVTDAAPLRLTFAGPGEMFLAPAARGVSGALSALAAILYRSTLSGDFERLKACRACRYAFYDASKNRSRQWCDMALCGSQQKARAYRSRKRLAAAESSAD